MQNSDVNLENGVSVLVPIKNRNEVLKQSLPTILENPEVKQVVIVDWNSDVPVSKALEAPLDKRILIVTVEEVEFWRSTKALNLGASFADQKFLSRIDVDCKLNPDFFSSLDLSEDKFYRGDPERARDENELGLSGSLVLSRKAFDAINGYNERLFGWGWGDDDIVWRLKGHGFEEDWFNYDKIYHIPHDDSSRIDSKFCSIKEINRTKNEYFARTRPWSREDNQTLYEITKINDQLYNCRIKEEHSPLYPEIEKDAMLSAYGYLTRKNLRSLLSETNGQLWGFSYAQLLEIKKERVRETNSYPSYLIWLVREELKQIYNELKDVFGI